MQNMDKENFKDETLICPTLSLSKYLRYMETCHEYKHVQQAWGQILGEVFKYKYKYSENTKYKIQIQILIQRVYFKYKYSLKVFNYFKNTFVL